MNPVAADEESAALCAVRVDSEETLAESIDQVDCLVCLDVFEEMKRIARQDIAGASSVKELGQV